MDKDYIVANIRPFIFKQNVSVYQDGNCIRTLKCKIDEIEKIIINLSDIYHVNKVNLVEKGNIYSLKIKDSLLSKYTDKNLEVTIW